MSKPEGKTAKRREAEFVIRSSSFFRPFGRLSAGYSSFVIRHLFLAALLVCALTLAPVAAAPKKPHPRSPTPHATPPPHPAPAELPPGEPVVNAQGAMLIDAFTGRTIFQKSPDQPFYPASTTKILTALLVIEEGDLDHEVVVDIEDTRAGESSLNLKPGETYTRRQMLYGLMLKSANDVAAALARDNAGSVDAFAAKMTQRARELGAASSHFANPHGLHNPSHYTTPHDLALIARAAMDQPLFRQVVSTVHYAWANSTGIVELRNHNRLLWEFPGCTGLKTGYTYPAQQVLVSSALWGTREVISVVMHTDRPGIWEDSKLLLTYGFSHLPERRSQF
jgi:serine-type D-Ala-D-Ala carboxypeptidase (penicillin-binding protein 5/6)